MMSGSGRFYTHCNEKHPGVEQMTACYYPVGHSSPHSWETLRPNESWASRDSLAFRARKQKAEDG